MFVRKAKPALFAAETADCKVAYGFSDDCDFIAKDIQYKENKLVSRCITMTNSC